MFYISCNFFFPKKDIIFMTLSKFTEPKTSPISPPTFCRPSQAVRAMNAFIELIMY